MIETVSELRISAGGSRRTQWQGETQRYINSFLEALSGHGAIYAHGIQNVCK